MLFFQQATTWLRLHFKLDLTCSYVVPMFSVWTLLSAPCVNGSVVFHGLFQILCTQVKDSHSMLPPLSDFCHPPVTLVPLGNYSSLLSQNNGYFLQKFQLTYDTPQLQLPQGNAEKMGTSPMFVASCEFQLSSRVHVLPFTLQTPWIIDFMYFFPSTYSCYLWGVEFVTSNRTIVCVFFYFIDFCLVFDISFLPFILGSIYYSFSNFLRLEFK